MSASAKSTLLAVNFQRIEQLHSLGYRALLTAIAGTVWKKRVRADSASGTSQLFGPDRDVVLDHSIETGERSEEEVNAA